VCVCAVREAVCVFGERGVLRPGQTLVERHGDGVCLSRQCSRSIDPTSGFNLLRSNSINCSAHCQPVRRTHTHTHTHNVTMAPNQSAPCFRTRSTSLRRTRRRAAECVGTFPASTNTRTGRRFSTRWKSFSLLTTRGRLC